MSKVGDKKLNFEYNENNLIIFLIMGNSETTLISACEKIILK